MLSLMAEINFSFSSWLESLNNESKKVSNKELFYMNLSFVFRLLIKIPNKFLNLILFKITLFLY